MSRQEATSRSLEKSHELKRAALERIPLATQTYSKGPQEWVQGESPAYLDRAEGCRVWDADGNEYIDYLMACGPVILGHSYPAVTEAVKRRAEKGPLLSMANELEIDVAERIIDAVPCAEMVRFGKNGNDVTTAAVRLARHVTGRNVVASHGYHGWGDVWEAADGGGNGVPASYEELIETFDYNDIESLERIFEEHPDDVAAIVMTPVAVSEPKDDFLQQVRELADREGALLVFDEVVSGFRFGLGGAQEHFGVTPDIGCFAKAIANGYPLSAIAGREDVMEQLEETTFSLTYGGDTVSLAAARATIDTLREEDVHDHIADLGRTLRQRYNELAADHGLEDRTECVGFDPMLQTPFTTPDGESDPAAKSLFMQECHRRGVLFNGLHFPTYGHDSADVEETLRVYDEAMGLLSDAIESDAVEDRLDGAPVGTPPQP